MFDLLKNESISVQKTKLEELFKKDEWKLKISTKNTKYKN